MATKIKYAERNARIYCGAFNDNLQDSLITVSLYSYAELTQGKYSTHRNRRGVVKIKLSDGCVTFPKPVGYEAFEDHFDGQFVAYLRV